MFGERRVNREVRATTVPTYTSSHAQYHADVDAPSTSNHMYGATFVL